jgi:hypothetical protein
MVSKGYHREGNHRPALRFQKADLNRETPRRVSYLDGGFSQMSLTLGSGERLLAATLGAVMIAAGVRRRSRADSGCGVAGCGLLFLALTWPGERATSAETFDPVEEASLESFPASDPPAWPSGPLSYGAPLK